MIARLKNYQSTLIDVRNGSQYRIIEHQGFSSNEAFAVTLWFLDIILEIDND
jgi:hypothetical protein